MATITHTITFRTDAGESIRFAHDHAGACDKVIAYATENNLEIGDGMTHGDYYAKDSNETVLMATWTIASLG